MKGAAIKTVGRAVGDRILGDGAGPVRAFVASAVTGTATAVITYRLLRNNQ